MTTGHDGVTVVLQDRETGFSYNETKYVIGIIGYGIKLV